ncbi:MAG: glucose 1-dehydrogenase [Chloroflexi bacterium]|nr:glucose 1-dehydrogenase [Chloroflexota bacterium]MCI0786824.1 glucose 1-dehydrogenase [Chloroflexota bacterium]MCI0798567.1 glucose 1-dehydrogenase [Chloroflexota bacterium]MCI0880178.1 glucose 1-dehydrogenase [Chloroflexota bacterium]
MTSGKLFDLTGRVAIVTGGNGGLGLGMALGLAEAGANIVVAARNQEKTAAALSQIQAQGVKAIGVTVDVNLESDISAMVGQTMEAFGRVDILVNNAGMTVRKEPQELSVDEWDQVLNVNLRAGFLAARDVYPHMKSQGGGKIICIGSMFSIFGGGGSGAPYSSSKGGLVQLSKSLAVAWAKDNIQSNAILPGWFMTELTSTVPVTQPERFDLISRRIPTGRWGQPEELKGAVVFLASPASDYVTGAVLTVDGGYSVT